MGGVWYRRLGNEYSVIVNPFTDIPLVYVFFCSVLGMKLLPRSTAASMDIHFVTESFS